MAHVPAERCLAIIELLDDGSVFFAAQESRQRLPEVWVAALRAIDGRATAPAGVTLIESDAIR